MHLPVCQSLLSFSGSSLSGSRALSQLYGIQSMRRSSIVQTPPGGTRRCCCQIKATFACECSKRAGMDCILSSVRSGLPVTAAPPEISSPSPREPAGWNEEASSPSRLPTASKRQRGDAATRGCALHRGAECRAHKSDIFDAGFSTAVQWEHGWNLRVHDWAFHSSL